MNRYLQQIGTILTFSTMQRSEAAEDTKRWKKGVLLLAILVVVGTGALSIAQRLTAQQLNRPAEQVQVLPPGARR